MRIVGGKDYYDHGLAFGVDQETVFVRDGHAEFVYRNPGVFPDQWGTAPPVEILPGERTVRHGSGGYESALRWTHHGVSYALDGVAVVFCGRYYGGARVRSYDPGFRDWYSRNGWNSPPSEHGWKSEGFWNQNSLGKFLATRGARVKTGARRRFSLPLPPEEQPFFRGPLDTARLSAMVEMGVAVALRTPEMTERLQRPGYSYPIDSAFWEINGDNLRTVNFIKVLDPVQAFQQLSMWVGGVLPRAGRGTVEITDDKIKLAKKGMDKWSFRRKGVNSK